MFFDQFGNPRMKKSKMGPASKVVVAWLKRVLTCLPVDNGTGV